MACSGIAGATRPEYPNPPQGILRPPPERPDLTWVECAPDFVCLTVTDAGKLLPYLEAVDRWIDDHQDLCESEE